MKHLLILKSMFGLQSICEYETLESALESAKRFISSGYTVRLAKEVPLKVDISFDVEE